MPATMFRASYTISVPTFNTAVPPGERSRLVERCLQQALMERENELEKIAAAFMADPANAEALAGNAAWEVASDLVSRYEHEHHAIPAAAPKDALRFLMEARGLKQDDLSAIVAQGNLSAILAGKRTISAALAGKLGKFFGISPAVFVPV